ncbi:MAG: hypothetical protein V4596_11575 [Bdellovibrionota bacterium]
MKSLFLFLIIFSINSFAQNSLNTQYPRVMACQNPSSNIYVEVFHDQSGFLGAPKNPTGYLILWSTIMGKDTQKRLVLDVPMKHISEGGSGCTLDIKWSQKKGSGADAISHFHIQVAACNMLDKAPKGKITQNDVYSSGKVITTSSDLNCQLQ